MRIFHFSIPIPGKKQDLFIASPECPTDLEVRRLLSNLHFDSLGNSNYDGEWFQCLDTLDCAMGFPRTESPGSIVSSPIQDMSFDGAVSVEIIKIYYKNQGGEVLV